MTPTQLPSNVQVLRMAGLLRCLPLPDGVETFLRGLSELVAEVYSPGLSPDFGQVLMSRAAATLSPAELAAALWVLGTAPDLVQRAVEAFRRDPI